MNRRAFITLLGGAAAAWPLAARAQQGERVRRVGVLMSYLDNDLEAQAWVAAFYQGLQKLGWVEGHNIHSDARWARGEDAEALQKFARELVALDPHVILSSSTPSTAALVQETRSIPIVFAVVVDPVGSGFVANFDRPGGNVTGFTNHEPTMAGKWLELLKEIAPRVRRAALLYNPGTAPYFEQFLGPFKTAAASLGVEAIASPVHDRADLELAIAALTRVPNGGLVAMTDSYMVAQRAEVTSLALRYHLPLVSPYRAYVELGGLLSYGASSLDNYRRASIYADRILKGIKPSELPVQVPVQFQLVVNAKTARAFGLELPSSFYWRADEVIE
jgi:putative tryptophan/tyrosine transport system substrate-binding protein